MASTQRKFAICIKTCKINLFPDFDNFEIELSSGELVEIVLRKDNKCHIKIRNFDKWSDEYKINIYLCPIENLSFVSSSLWPFLISIRNPIDRLNLAMNNILKEVIPDIEINSEITISSDAFKTIDKTLCKIHYKSVVPELGLGFFFIIELMSNNVGLKESNSLVKKYIDCKVGSSYIIVTASWIAKYLEIKEDFTVKPIKNVFPNVIDNNKMEWEQSSTVCPNNKNECSIHENEVLQKREQQQVILTPKSDSRQLVTEHPQSEGKWNCMKCTFGNNNVYQKCQMCDQSKNLNHQNFIENDYDRSGETLMSIDERFQCPCCNKYYEKGIILRNCLHFFCRNCLNKTISMSFNSRIKCPNPECNYDIQDREIRSIGGESVYEHLENRRMEEAKQNAGPNKFECQKCFTWCFQDDSFAVVQCPECKHCSVCEIIHVGQTCAEYLLSLETNQTSINHENNNNIISDIERNGLVINSKVIECPICHKHVSDGIKLRDCAHTFCHNCLTHAVTSSSECGIKCPEDTCQFDLQDREIKGIGGTEFYERILEKRLLEAQRNVVDNRFDCKVCNSWCIVEDCGVNFNCPNCDHCSVCSNLHLNMDCAQYFNNIDIR